MATLVRLFLTALVCTLFLMQTASGVFALQNFMLFFSAALWLSMSTHTIIKTAYYILFFIAVLIFGKTILFFSPLLLLSDITYVKEDNIEKRHTAYRKRSLTAIQIGCKAMLLAAILISLNFLFFMFAAVIFLYAIEIEHYAHVLRLYTNLRDTLTERTVQYGVQKRQLQNEMLKNAEAALLAERNRISGELHNAIGHTVSSAIVQINALKYIDARNEIQAQLDILQSSLERGLTEIRACLHNLHNDSFDLRTCIEQLIEQAAKTLRIQLTCETETMPYTLKYDILSVVKECLSNTLQHSGASAMSITILEHPAFYSVSVQDNGKGAGFTEPRSMRNTGIGLTVLSEIAARHNGHIHFYPQNGFKVHITFSK